MNGARWMVRTRLVVRARRAWLLAGLLACGLALTAAPSALADTINVTGSWSSTYFCSSGWCAGETFPDTIVLRQAAGSTTVTGTENIGETITGTLSGDQLTFSESGGGYTANFDVTISSDGGSWSGNVTDSNGTSGSDTATRQMYDVSGTLSSNDCSNTTCTPPQPVSDTTVTVTSTDGSTSTSDVSDGDGDWSVSVPAGDYTVVPEGDGWDPETQSVTVGPDAPNINFNVCAPADDEEASDLVPTPFGRIATTQATNPCQRLYTIRVVAWNPYGSIADPIVGSDTFDGKGYPEEAKGFFNDFYPPCVPEDLAKSFASSRPEIEWRAAWPGSNRRTPAWPGWGYVTAQISWNGKDSVAEIRGASATPGTMSRQYDYKIGKHEYSCPKPVTRPIEPQFRVTLLSENTFEIDASWVIPFQPFENLEDVKDFNEALLVPLTEKAKAELEAELNTIPGYSGLSESQKTGAKKFAVWAAEHLGAKAAIKLVKDAIKEGGQYLTDITPPPIKIGKKAVEILKKVSYGAAEVRIIGTFTTNPGLPDAHVAGSTKLTVNTSTDGFPSFALVVSRPQGEVPWFGSQVIHTTQTNYGGDYGSLPNVINDAVQQTGAERILQGGPGVEGFHGLIETQLSILSNSLPKAAQAFLPPFVVGTDSQARTISWMFDQQRS